MLGTFVSSRVSVFSTTGTVHNCKCWQKSVTWKVEEDDMIRSFYALLAGRRRLKNEFFRDIRRTSSMSVEKFHTFTCATFFFFSCDPLVGRADLYTSYTSKES